MSDQTRRQPLLADLVINAPEPPVVNKRIYDATINKVRAAERYRFNDKAVQRVGAVIREIPDLLVREQQFARASDLMWLEWNARALHKATNPDAPYDPIADENMGILIDHNTVYTFANERGTGSCMMPFVYDMHRPWDAYDIKAFCNRLGIPDDPIIPEVLVDIESYGGVQALSIDIIHWGNSTPIIAPTQHPDELRQHSMRMLPLADSMPIGVVRELLTRSVGDMRNTIALLLMLNRPSIVEHESEVPRWRGFHKGKHRVFLSHTVVTINLDPIPILRQSGVVHGPAEPKRRHNVRHTWCHDAVYRKGSASGCVHEWQPHPDYCNDVKHLHLENDGCVEFNNFKCKLCGGHRWWRVKHERGDASKGFVVKEHYNVKG